VYRQADRNLTDLLDGIRMGAVSTEQRELLRYLKRPLCTHGGVKATRLLTMNKRVDMENNKAFDALSTEEYTYIAQDWGEATFLDRLRKGCNCVEHLRLKVGAQVMCLRNMTTVRNRLMQEMSVQLCNGSRGVVSDFIAVADVGVGQRMLPLVKFIEIEEPVLVTELTWELDEWGRDGQGQRYRDTPFPYLP
jgi:hypothetical protein